MDLLVAWLDEHGGQREGCAAPIPGGRKRRISERAWIGRTCKACGQTWTVPEGQRLGQPPHRCPECRAINAGRRAA